MNRRRHKPSRGLTADEQRQTLKSFVIDDDPPVPEWLTKLGEKVNAATAKHNLAPTDVPPRNGRGPRP